MRKFNTRCFLDIKIGNADAERVVFELFDEKCPMACDNFKKLCQGICGIGIKTGKLLHYQNSSFHRIVKGFIIQGGDFSNGDGTGGESIYGGTFADEDMSLSHDRPFLLSMANRGPNTNGSQFFITTAPAPHLNNKHMVFGHVLSGQDVVAKIESVPVADTRLYKPLKPVFIVNCGELVPIKKKKIDALKQSSKKKKKKEKSSKKNLHKRKSSLSESDSVEPKSENVPDVPINKFLCRSCPSDSKNSNAADQDLSKYKPGRKVKGRGQVRYRTPDSRPGSSDRGITPEHWHQGTSKHRRQSLEEVSLSETKRRKRLHGSPKEKYFKKSRSRSPLNTTERESVKIPRHLLVMDKQSPKHRKNASTRPSDVTNGKGSDRCRDNVRRRASRRTSASSSDERLSRQAQTPSPVRRLVENPSLSELKDQRHGYHRRRTPSPTQPPQNSPRRQVYSQSESGRNASESIRSSISGRSPSPSSHRIKSRTQKRKPSRSPSPSQSSRKRSNEHKSRRESPPISNRPSSRRRTTSRNRSESAERPQKVQSRGDLHGSLRDPPAHLINKWEERRKQVLRKRDSLLKVSRRRDVSPGSRSNSSCRHSSSASRSRSPPCRLNPAASARDSSSPSSRSPSPVKTKSDPDVALDKTAHSSAYETADPIATKSPQNSTSPPEAMSKWDQSSPGNADAGVELRRKEVEAKEKTAINTASPQSSGPWTTSRWQTDDGSVTNLTSVEVNTSAKISPVKIALGGNSEMATVVPTSIDMDVSDSESEAKKSKVPIRDLQNGYEASNAPKLENRTTTQSISSSEPKPPPMSSSASSTSISSSGSSSSDTSSSHSRNASQSPRRKKSIMRRGRSKSSSRPRFRRRRSPSHRSTSRRRHSRRICRDRKNSWSRRSRSYSNRSRRRRRSSSYSRRRRRSYSSYSHSTRSSYSSASRR